MNKAKYESLLKERESHIEEIRSGEVDREKWDKIIIAAQKVEEGFKTKGKFTIELDYGNEPENEAPDRHLFNEIRSETTLSFYITPDRVNLPGNRRLLTFRSEVMPDKLLDALRNKKTEAESNISKYKVKLEKLNRNIASSLKRAEIADWKENRKMKSGECWKRVKYLGIVIGIAAGVLNIILYVKGCFCK